MNFDWDEQKAKKNLAKHGVSFDLARRVWEDPLHVILPDRVEDGEQRWHAWALSERWWFWLSCIPIAILMMTST